MQVIEFEFAGNNGRGAPQRGALAGAARCYGAVDGGERRLFAMTIGKTLYGGFGSVLSILRALFIVNLISGFRESSARKYASTALESVRAIESVRYQIMLNRLNLNNFLLSGDPRDEEKVTRGLQELIEIMKRGEAQA